MQLPTRRFSEMTESELGRSDTSRWIAVLPLGATEYHGPHLPAATDAIIAAGIAEMLAAALPPEIPMTVLPVEDVGYSPEHMDRPETISLTYEEALGRWISIGSSLSKHGIRKLMLLNAHGGNSPLLSVVATELRVRENMLCVATSWSRFGTPVNLIAPGEQALGIHGGAIETSVMLAIAPDQVRLDKAKKFVSLQAEMEQKYRHLRAYGRHAFGWKMSDLNLCGAVGDARSASAEKGKAILDHCLRGLQELVVEINDFGLAEWKL